MREIKFRAWDKRAMELPPSMYYFSFKDAHKYVRCGNIMQFTGLKDCNGVDIYEGDIITFVDSDGTQKTYYREVEWDNDSGSWCVNMNDTSVACAWWPTVVEMGPVEVIGNIHENPELLQG